MPMLLGRNRSTTEIPKLKLSNYRGVLPTPPATFDYSDKADATLRNVYLNDQYGCCVISAGAHIRGVTSANAGGEVAFADGDIKKMYRIIGGPGDNGANLQDAMSYWTKTGFTDGVKLMGWLAVDATNPTEYKTACWLFENLFFGIESPNHWFNPMPQGDDFVWDVAGPPVPRNGHCTAGVGYDEDGIKLSTWGMLGTLTDDAITRYGTRQSGGELYVLVSPDQIAKAQTKAPNGLDWHQLITDFNLLGGHLPVPEELQPQPISWADTF